MSATETIQIATCGGCRHWRIAPDHRHIFGFAERLSKQIGRRVEIGYCHATYETGTGPTADADWCEKWEAKSPGERPGGETLAKRPNEKGQR